MVEAFIGHFSAHGRACTVRTKSVHLKKLPDSASSYFHEKGARELAEKASSVSKYLRSVSCVQKSRLVASIVSIKQGSPESSKPIIPCQMHLERLLTVQEVLYVG